MALVTVVEAAGLCGLAPERIRELIERGGLAAQRVALPGGAAFLIELDEVERLRGGGVLPAAGAVGAVSALEGALDGLRASLARWRDGAGMAVDADEEGPLNRPMPAGRTASGPRAAELESLATRMERLLG